MNEIKIGDLVRKYNDQRPKGRCEVGVVTHISDKFETCYVHWRSAELPTGFYLPSMLVVLDGKEPPADKDIIVM